MKKKLHHARHSVIFTIPFGLYFIANLHYSKEVSTFMVIVQRFQVKISGVIRIRIIVDPNNLLSEYPDPLSEISDADVLPETSEEKVCSHLRCPLYRCKADYSERTTFPERLIHDTFCSKCRPFLSTGHVTPLNQGCLFFYRCLSCFQSNKKTSRHLPDRKCTLK